MADPGDLFEHAGAIVIDVVSVGIASVAVAFLGTGALVIVAAVAGIELPRPDVPRALATERLHDEVAVAERVGFVRLEDVALREEDQSHTLELEADECVAGVASAWGAHRIDSVTAAPGARAADERHALARDVYVPGLVAHVQACPANPGPFTVRVVSNTAPLSSDDPPFGTLVILRGPADRMSRRLNRGELDR